MSQRLNLSIELGKQIRNRAKGSSQSQQIIIIVLGSFAGGTDIRNPQRISDTSLHQVDIDSFDQLMQRLMPSLEVVLPGSDQALNLDFKSLDDFHPDQLYERLPLFQSGLSSKQPSELPIPEILNDSDPQGQSESDQQTLTRLLGKGSTSSSHAKKKLIESVVQKLANDSSQADLSREPDSASEQLEDATPLMRQLLHHPDFQALESHWRGLDWLVRNIEPDDGFQLYVMNTTRHALQMSLQQNQDIHQTGLLQIVKDQVAEASLSEYKLILMCDDSFAPTVEDISYLEGLGRLADAVDASLITAANERFTDTEDSNSHGIDAWLSFRETALASRVTLVLPRVLLRLPYGKNYEPIDAFPFEELDQDWCATELLWGNPAYALAILLTARHLSNDSTKSPVLMDCPTFAFRKDDESRLQPSTERLYQEHEIEQILNLGLIPMIGSCRSNSIQLPWL